MAYVQFEKSAITRRVALTGVGLAAAATALPPTLAQTVPFSSGTEPPKTTGACPVWKSR